MMQNANQQIVEASTIGLRPGEWPNQLRHGGRTFRLLRKDDVKRDREGDIVSVTYREVRTVPGFTLATATATLEVLND